MPSTILRKVLVMGRVELFLFSFLMTSSAYRSKPDLYGLLYARAFIEQEECQEKDMRWKGHMALLHVTGGLYSRVKQ